MHSDNSTKDLLTDDVVNKPKLPIGLNVLTILTFVGSAFELYSALKNFFAGSESLREFEKAQEQLENAPSWAKKMASPEAYEMIVKAMENKIPLFIITLVSLILCIYGAIEMRKLKKQGYTLWIIGEILPYIGVIIFIGGIYFKTIYAYMMVFPIVFILLYTLQRKHLVR